MHTGTRTASVTAEAERVFTPEQFGAAANAVTDDTVAICKAGKAALVGGGGTVAFRRRTGDGERQPPREHAGWGGLRECPTHERRRHRIPQGDAPAIYAPPVCNWGPGETWKGWKWDVQVPASRIDMPGDPIKDVWDLSNMDGGRALRIRGAEAYPLVLLQSSGGAPQE